MTQALEASSRLHNLQRNRLDLVRSTLFVVNSLVPTDKAEGKTPTHQRIADLEQKKEGSGNHSTANK